MESRSSLDTFLLPGFLKSIIAAGSGLLIYWIIVVAYVLPVGSSNIDVRSLEINFEMNCFIYAPQIAACRK